MANNKILSLGIALIILGVIGNITATVLRVVYVSHPTMTVIERVHSIPTMTPAPTATPYVYIPVETDYGEVNVTSIGWIGEPRRVCTPTLDVHGAPGDQFPVLYTLSEGDEVRIGEWSRDNPGWLMIGRAEWVWSWDLCGW